MADWLDTADKVASLVGAASGVAALVFTLRSNSRRDAPNSSKPARDADALLPPAPDQGSPVGPFTVPDWSDAASRAGFDRGTPSDQRPDAEPRPEHRTPPPPPLFSGSRPVPPPTYPEDQPGWGAPPGGMPYPVQPPTAGLPDQAPRSGVGFGGVLGLLVFGVGTALLGAWLLSWLLSWLGGGSVGPWWLLAGMAASYGLGLFFWFTKLDGPGMVRLYVVWVPAAAWLLARTVAYHWFPDLSGNQGAVFIIVFVAVLLIGAAIGLRKSFSSR